MKDLLSPSPLPTKPLLTMFLFVAFSFLVAVPAATAEVMTYTVDKAHSTVGFKIRHLLSKTSGRFHDYEGTIKLDPEKRESVEVTGTIQVTSIDTDEDDRDEHLRNEDFFNVAKFPTITFKASKLTDVNEDRTSGKLAGEMTMHGVTKPIVLDVSWYGTVTDPWGNKKAGFSGVTTVNRKDFGIIWNKALDAGGVVLGEDVEVSIEIEADLVEADSVEDES
jgi:polyisoprenoid-binding protein YceI